MIIGMRGYCGIGIMTGKTPENTGMLWRSAHVLGADFIFTIGARYRTQVSDTMRSARHVPLWEFEDLEQLQSCQPAGSELVAVEMMEEAAELEGFRHPQRAIYLLGAEDVGLPLDAMANADWAVRIPGERSLNVAVAGSIVLYDRLSKS
jgi:tRNA G18 (ribose-2'-O)-methylase SpoU